MPVADFTPEYKRSTDFNFDRLKLKLNEKARIVILEKPTFAWVHTMRAPKIVNGQAVKVMKKRGGEEILDYDLDFIGRPLCLGDNSILHDDAIDPKNCPVCARAKDTDEVSPPERRFAVNVIRYGLQRDGMTIADPFTCSCLVWAFPESTYNKLYGIAQEYKNRGGLLGLDLILGPCQSPEAFQKFDIMAGSEVIWKLDEAITQNVLKTYENNKVEELENACGRKTELRWIKDDLKKIADRWAIAHGAAEDPGLQPDLGAGLSELLNTRTEAATAPAVTKSYADNPTGQAQPAPESPHQDDSPQQNAEPSSFKSLLTSLNLGN